MTTEPATIAPLCQDVPIVGFRPSPEIAKAIKSLCAITSVTEDMVEELHRKGDREEHGPIASQYIHTQAYKLEMLLKEIYSVSEIIERLPCSRNMS